TTRLRDIVNLTNLTYTRSYPPRGTGHNGGERRTVGPARSAPPGPGGRTKSRFELASHGSVRLWTDLVKPEMADMESVLTLSDAMTISCTVLSPMNSANVECGG
ncbi:MAG: hypothetical protein OXI15_09070, partial [Chromatiales bacterium]|nr:hypothetical protein [Chromatiales bacterium]